MAFSPKAWSFYCFNTKSEVFINPSNLSKLVLKLSTMQLLVSLLSALGLLMLLSLWFLEALFVYVQLGNSQELAIKKNTFESVLMRWMKLEPIIQSEVSQKEKHQYSILTHICGI